MLEHRLLRDSEEVGLLGNRDMYFRVKSTKLYQNLQHEWIQGCRMKHHIPNKVQQAKTLLRHWEQFVMVIADPQSWGHVGGKVRCTQSPPTC